MKRFTRLLATLLLTSPCGCALVEQSVHNTMAGPRRLMENCAEDKRNRVWADAAWREKVAKTGNIYSNDYAVGFHEGYIDYLKQGGSGEPPPYPPRRFWATCFQNEQGCRAIDNWFAGFREGAFLARLSGQREMVTLPTPGTGCSPVVVADTPLPVVETPVPAPAKTWVPPPAQVPAAPSKSMPAMPMPMPPAAAPKTGAPLLNYLPPPTPMPQAPTPQTPTPMPQAPQTPTPMPPTPQTPAQPEIKPEVTPFPDESPPLVVPNPAVPRTENAPRPRIVTEEGLLREKE